MTKWLGYTLPKTANLDPKKVIEAYEKTEAVIKYHEREYEADDYKLEINELAALPGEQRRDMNALAKNDDRLKLLSKGSRKVREKRRQEVNKRGTIKNKVKYGKIYKDVVPTIGRLLPNGKVKPDMTNVGNFVSDDKRKIDKDIENMQTQCRTFCQDSSQFPGCKYYIYRLRGECELMSLNPSDLAELKRKTRDLFTSDNVPLFTYVEFMPDPEEINWLKLVPPVPVLHQGLCGCCWAIAVVCKAETPKNVSTFHKVFSEVGTYIVGTCASVNDFCNLKSHGCKYGYFATAAEYFRLVGAVDESDYPFMQKDGQQCSLSWQAAVKVTDYDIGYAPESQRRSRTPEELERRLQERVAHAPVAVGIAVTDQLWQYKSGIFGDSECRLPKNKIPDHAVVVVGYTRDYWIVQNSWGVNWGLRGIFHLKRGSNLCGIASYWYQPTGMTIGTFHPKGDTSSSEELNNYYEGVKSVDELPKGCRKYVNTTMSMRSYTVK